MSDGNFNRSLLPAGGYASGVRAGESRMRKRALEAFRQWVAETHPHTPDDQRATWCQQFAHHLE